MATKTITITEEAYKRLVQSKKGEESFSKVIVRVTGNAHLIRPLFGFLTHEEADHLEKRILENRKRWQQIEAKRREEVRRQLHGMP